MELKAPLIQIPGLTTLALIRVVAPLNSSSPLFLSMTENFVPAGMSAT